MSAAAMGMDLLTSLRRERETQGLSKAEVARRIGCGRAYFSKLEDGYHLPKLDFLLSWVKCLGLVIRVEKSTVTP